MFFFLLMKQLFRATPSSIITYHFVVTEAYPRAKQEGSYLLMLVKRNLTQDKIIFFGKNKYLLFICNYVRIGVPISGQQTHKRCIIASKV